jgi:hypothetical protein
VRRAESRASRRGNRERRQKEHLPQEGERIEKNSRADSNSGKKAITSWPLQIFSIMARKAAQNKGKRNTGRACVQNGKEPRGIDFFTLLLFIVTGSSYRRGPSFLSWHSLIVIASEAISSKINRHISNSQRLIYKEMGQILLEIASLRSQ